MITTRGSQYIRQYNARYVGSIGDSLSIGLVGTAPTKADIRMAYEVVRAPINSIGTSQDLGTFILQATLPRGTALTAYEIGVWAGAESYDALGTVITSFNNEVENWVGSVTFTATNARFGQGMSLTGGAASVNTGVSSFANYKDDDEFMLAAHATVASNVTVFLGQDDSNGFSATFPVASGYNVTTVKKKNFTQVAGGRWDAIETIKVTVTTGTVTFDCFKIESGEPQLRNQVLVARYALSTPKTLSSSLDTDLEYALAVNA